VSRNRLRQVAAGYSAELEAKGVSPSKHVLSAQLATHEQARAHVLWMCHEIQDFCDEALEADAQSFELEKAHRWLGFVQGVLWLLGDKTIDQMRDDNRG